MSRLEKFRGGQSHGPQITGQPVLVETGFFAETSPDRWPDWSATVIALVDSAAPAWSDGLN